MTRHTPGPWEKAIALLVVKRLADGTASRICECVIGHEADANARLIVAAPELLEACKAALQFIAPHVEDEEYEGREGAALRLNDTLAQAIAKAEGT